MTLMNVWISVWNIVLTNLLWLHYQMYLTQLWNHGYTCTHFTDGSIREKWILLIIFVAGHGSLGEIMQHKIYTQNGTYTTVCLFIVSWVARSTLFSIVEVLYCILYPPLGSSLCTLAHIHWYRPHPLLTLSNSNQISYFLFRVYICRYYLHLSSEGTHWNNYIWMNLLINVTIIPEGRQRRNS